MRARSREVNIFNMSLLDILTGMLGAFLFLMLGLVPYYMRAQNPQNQQNQNQTPPIDNVINVVAQWNTPAKLDIFLLDTDGTWRGANVKSMPLSRMGKIVNNCCMSGYGWASSSAYASPGDKFLLACSLQPTNDNSGPPGTLMLSFDLNELESSPLGTGMKSYAEDVFAATTGVAGAQPGRVYGLYWIVATRDQSKKEYYQQYDFDANPVKPSDKLPRGVLPPPAALDTSTTAPAGPVSLINTLGGTGGPPSGQSSAPPR